MPEWTRDTPWRQGHLLTEECAKKLGLQHPESPDETVVLVISHDCDLAQLPPDETNCEAIVGRIIKQPKGNFTHGKNVRTLHLSFSDGERRIDAEFIATRKTPILKAALSVYAPEAKVRLKPDELLTLQSWLAARYKRSTFADQFQERLKAVRNKLDRAIEKSGDNVIRVYFYVDKNREVERTHPDDVYDLTIYLVYSSEKPAGSAEGVAVATATSIKSLFRNAYFIEGRWQHIELRDCYPISEEGMTVGHARRLREWLPF